MVSQTIDNCSEHVLLDTDRNIYIVGEDILFSTTRHGANDVSKIIYIELLTPNGKQIAGSKFKLDDDKCSGLISIPEDITSGNYYLRAYTKYMRNFGPYQYNYQVIKIINPYKKEILNEQYLKDSLNFTTSNISLKQGDYNIQLTKDVFQTREKVNVIINLDQNKKDTIINTIISVVPMGVANSKILNPKNFKNNSLMDINSTLYYKPETRGITLSGAVKDKNTNDAITKIKVNLSILDSTRNSFFSTLTNENGQFFFILPDLIGYKDIFISPQHIENKTPNLLVDNDFCTEPILLPNPTFSLTSIEQSAAYNLAINKKVKDQFKSDTIIGFKNGNNKNDTLPFYGLPASTLKINDYINLPTLEDYFTEIPFLVKIKKYDGKKQFVVLGKQAELDIYDPLVMVDLISINQIQRILEISPKKVERIEVINAPYVLGDIIYGGIINIISIKNDWAGIKLPESGMFLNYLFLDEKDYSYSLSTWSENIPDTRNTLYWSPINTLTKDYTLEFDFTTSDTTGDYVILVTGITKLGERIHTSINFKVK